MDVKGKVMTVTGPINPSALGITLPHEHIYIHTPDFFTQPPTKFQNFVNAPFDLPVLGWIRQNPYSHKPNLTTVGEDDTLREELLLFKENGGNTIVEHSTTGMSVSNRLNVLKSLAESSGVNIVAGTGFYAAVYQQEAVKNYSEEKLAAMMRSDLIDGIDGVRCGIIGEVGCDWPIADFEKRSLRGAAAVQEELGCPVNVHPGRDSNAPTEIMRIFAEAGGNPRKTIISHLDRTYVDSSDLLEFAEVGTYLEYDLFGIETSHYQFDVSKDMPNDAQRLEFIKILMNNGLEDRVMIAQDIHTKHRLVKYGGHGYSHILLNIVPKMLSRGITQEQVDTLIKHNPRRWLTFE